MASKHSGDKAAHIAAQILDGTKSKPTKKDILMLAGSVVSQHVHKSAPKKTSKK